MLSDVVFKEIDNCFEPKRKNLADFIESIQYDRVKSSDELDALAVKCIESGVLKEKSFDDCRHFAAALLSGCNIIVSWNFKHMVNPKTYRGIRAIAIMEGYKDLMICPPTMLIGGFDGD